MLAKASAQKELRATPEQKVKPTSAMAIAIVIAAAFLLLQQTILGSHWETNDDVAYTLVASGCAIAPAPDEHLLTPNAFVGLALKTLYTAFPGMPWYFLLLIGSQFLATTTIAYVMFRKHSPLIAGILLSGFFLASGVYLATSLQFTSTALLTGMAGGLALLLRMERPAPATGESRILVAASILLFAVCSLIRVSCAYLTVLLTGIAIVCRAVPRFDTTVRNNLLSLASALLLCFGLQMLGKAHTEQDGLWRDFNKSRPALTKIIDFAGLSQSSTEKVLRDTNWSENDLAMLKNFLYCDAKVFPSDRIVLAAGGVPTVRQDISFDYLKAQIGQIASDKLLYPLILMAALAVWFLPRDGMSKGRFLALAAGTVACALYMLCCLKLPARVYFPLSTFLLLGSFFYSCDANIARLLQGSRAKAVKIALGGVLAAAAAFSLWVDYRWVWKPVKSIARQATYLHQLLRQLPQDKTYVVFAYAFPYELLPPAQDPHVFFAGVKLLTVGGYNNSPIFEEQKRHLGISDVCTDLLQPNVVLISTDYLNQFYIKYMAEHYGFQVIPRALADYKPLPLQLFKIEHD